MRYEVMVLRSHLDDIGEKLFDAQNQGWRIAGPIESHNGYNRFGTYLEIPMKRQLDEISLSSLEKYLKQIESKYPFDQPPTLEGFAEWLRTQETEK